MNWTYLKTWVLARASEKSTWTGIAALVVGATGHAVTPALAPQIDVACGLIASVVLVITKEQGSPT